MSSAEPAWEQLDSHNRQGELVNGAGNVGLLRSVLHDGELLGVGPNAPVVLAADPVAIAVLEMLRGLGLDVGSEHLLETPRRVADALREFCNPQTDLLGILKQGFANASPDQTGAMVLQVDIPLRGLCPHHLMPWFGTADVAYIPNQRVVGLSKIARVVGAAGTMAPSMQEQVTNLIADTFHKGLDAEGTYVITTALHTCMCTRGVNTPNVKTRVSAIRGLFVHAGPARAEALDLMRTGH